MNRTRDCDQPPSLRSQRAARHGIDRRACAGVRSVFVALVAAFVAAACAGSGAPGRTAALPKGDGSCVRVAEITSFTYLDRTRVVLNAGEPYVMYVESGCPSFSFTDETIGFATRDGRICDYRSEEIVTPDGRCRILAISRYSADADASREIDEAIESETESGSDP
jgi:hypothetical protein